MPDSKICEEPLEVFDSKELAERELTRYTNLCRSWKLVPKYRVAVRPMQAGKGYGFWGLWLVEHS